MKTPLHKIIDPLVSFVLAASVLLLLLALPVAKVQAAGVLPMATYIDGSATVISVAGSNVTVNALFPAGTNTFNLPGQADTNLWPAISLPPGNNINPVRLLCLQAQFACSTSDTSHVIIRFHGSADNSHWVTNVATLDLVAAGTAVVNQITNLDMYATPYWCVGSIEHAGAARVTNLVFTAVGKPLN